MEYSGLGTSELTVRREVQGKDEDVGLRLNVACGPVDAACSPVSSGRRDGKRRQTRGGLQHIGGPVSAAREAEG